MVEKITSVGQVHNIIQEALDIGEVKSIDVWAYVFDTDKWNQKIIVGVTQLFVLFGKAKEELSYLEDYQNKQGLDVLNRIEKNIFNTLHGDWNSFKVNTNQDMLGVLSLCNELLKTKKYSFKEISDTQLEKLKEQIRNLIDDFLNSDLPRDLKLDLIIELRKIEDALLNFYISGEARLKQVCNEVQASIINKASEKPKVFKQFISSVRKVVSTAVTIGGLMTTYDLSVKYQPLLADQIINLIENMPDEADNIQLELEAISKPQQMDATIENNTNHKCLPSGEEE